MRALSASLVRTGRMWWTGRSRIMGGKGGWIGSGGPVVLATVNVDTGLVGVAVCWQAEMQRGVYFRPKGDPDSSQAKTKVCLCRVQESRGLASHRVSPRRNSPTSQVPRGWLPEWRPITARCHEGERHELLPSWENLPRHRAACCEMTWEFRKIIASRLVSRRVPRRRMSSSTRLGVGVVHSATRFPECERLLQLHVPYEPRNIYLLPEMVAQRVLPLPVWSLAFLLCSVPIDPGAWIQTMYRAWAFGYASVTNNAQSVGGAWPVLRRLLKTGAHQKPPGREMAPRMSNQMPDPGKKSNHFWRRLLGVQIAPYAANRFQWGRVPSSVAVGSPWPG